ncbi:MAG: GDP-mannose 4,6-dehydratase [Myxococcaceae bacterium]
MPSNADRRAIVVGHRGQDGQLLTKLLLGRGYGVLGLDRGVTDALGGASYSGEVLLDQPQTVFEAVRAFGPTEVYYLAAHHVSSEGGPATDVYGDSLAGATVNITGPLHFLEALRRHAPKGRMFFASSSLIFGSSPAQQPQNESTPVAPDEPYGWQKALTGRACAGYRRLHGVFASVGILYNHESSLRPPQFLSMKLVHAAVRASRGATEKLVVGNLDAVVDWGFAGDYVDAFTRILALDTPDEFVVATGEAHTVRDFARIAFARVNLDWERYLTVDPGLLSRKAGARVGDSGKLRRATGWKPAISFEQLVQSLVDEAAR